MAGVSFVDGHIDEPRMTTQEALDWCEQFIDTLVKVVDSEKRTLALQAMQVCKSALEKQMEREREGK